MSISLGPTSEGTQSAKQRLDCRCETVGLHLRLGVGFRFDHHANEGFRARHSDQHATSTSHPSKGGIHERSHRTIDIDGLGCDSHVLEDLGQAGHRIGCKLGERTTGPSDHVEQLHCGEQTITGCGKLAKDHVPGLLTTERQPPGVQRFEHVAVTDPGVDDLDAGCFHRTTKTEVGHDRDDNGIVGECSPCLCVAGTDCDDLIAVDQPTVFVDCEHSVGVAVKGHAEIGTVLDNRFAERLDMRGAAAGIDVRTGWSGMDERDIGSQSTERIRCDLERSTVGGVDHDPNTIEAAPLHAADNCVDMRLCCGLMGIGDRRGHDGVSFAQESVESGLNPVLDGVAKLAPARRKELDPVVVPRVVRGRNHCTGHVTICTPTSHCRRRDHAEISGGSAGVSHTGMHGSGEFGAGPTRITANRKGVGPEFLGSGPRQGAHNVDSELGAGIAAHAVGTEAERHSTIIGRNPPTRTDLDRNGGRIVPSRPGRAELALAVLRSLAGLLEAVLLAFLLAGIASEESGLLE